jgi:SAM-dependent methyltransferase
VKLNIGCGRNIRDGWVNIDSVPLPGVDHVIDLDDKPVLPFPDSSVTLIEGSHVIEHLHHPLPLMEELWRVAEPDAVAIFRTPYGSSDEADEDPTHVRRMFLQSWGYFGQPLYWRADYGYRGDWRITAVELHIDPAFTHLPDEQVMVLTRLQRNVVREMVAVLQATKPAREPLRELQETFDVVIKHREV